MPLQFLISLLQRVASAMEFDTVLVSSVSKGKIVSYWDWDYVRLFVKYKGIVIFPNLVHEPELILNKLYIVHDC